MNPMCYECSQRPVRKPGDLCSLCEGKQIEQELEDEQMEKAEPEEYIVFEAPCLVPVVPLNSKISVFSLQIPMVVKSDDPNKLLDNHIALLKKYILELESKKQKGTIQ